jgi:hemolysin-activating ACP:hemolysin acyltransferase
MHTAMLEVVLTLSKASRYFRIYSESLQKFAILTILPSFLETKRAVYTNATGRPLCAWLRAYIGS